MSRLAALEQRPFRRSSIRSVRHGHACDDSRRCRRRSELVLALVDRAGKVSRSTFRGRSIESALSPDGKHVAVEVVDAAGRGQIWIYDLAGDSAIRRLTQSGDNTRPIWTPDSSSVTFGSERDGTWGIFEQPADG